MWPFVSGFFHLAKFYKEKKNSMWFLPCFILWFKNFILDVNIYTLCTSLCKMYLLLSHIIWSLQQSYKVGSNDLITTISQVTILRQGELVQHPTVKLSNAFQSSCSTAFSKELHHPACIRPLANTEYLHLCL